MADADAPTAYDITAHAELTWVHGPPGLGEFAVEEGLFLFHADSIKGHTIVMCYRLPAPLVTKVPRTARRARR